MKKRLAYLMACSLVASPLQATTLAKAGAKADLEVTLKLDYPVSDYKQMDLKAILLSEDGKEVATMPINSTTTRQDKTEEHIVFENVPLGTYKVRLTGKGYKTYTSEDIKLITTQKHLVVHAGKNTFAAGDLNQDAKIDAADLKQLESKLGTDDLSHDLNGDQIVDIEDLAQLYWSQNTEGKSEVYNTQLILASVLDEDEVADSIEAANEGRLTIDGSISQLFDGSDETTVELSSAVPITEENPIKIPIHFKDETMVSQITLTAPLGDAPTAGFVVYTDENGNEVRQPFNTIETYQTAAISTIENYQTAAISTVETYQNARTKTTNQVIKINLGRQVPIQKLTIEVTQTNHQSGLLASISKIEFLEDVVDQAINQEQGYIKGLTGKSLDGGVRLSWNQTANITGYKVKYGTQPGQYTETAYTSTNSIEIKGLENFTDYYFVVQAINGDWEGPVSSEITVVPQPQNKPSAPTEVNVASFDKALKVSFRLGEEATSARVYYKKVTDREYTVIQDFKSGSLIKNLENDIEYMVYVTAVNEAGESIPSAVVKATPVEETIILPEIPTVGRLDASHIKEIKLLDNQNVDQKFYPEGFDIQNLIDENYQTHWTAATYQRARGISVTFDQSYEMDYVAFVPRLDSDLDRYEGTRKYWEYPFLYSIKVWETLDSEPKTLMHREKIPKIGKDGLMILPFDKTTVAKMEIELFEWDGAGNMSISEVMFYEYQDMIERIENVFANGTYTKVKDGVTVDEIDALIKELDALEGAVLWVDKAILKEELEGAKELLLAGSMSQLGEIVEVVQTRQKSTAQNQNFAAGGLSNLQAAGVMAYAGEEIIVYVDAPEGGTMPELVVSQFYGDETWSRVVTLKQGRNIIQVPQLVNYNIQKGGPLYLTYTGEEQDATTVRIVKAHRIPTLEMPNLDNEVEAKAQIKAYINELTSYVSNLNGANKTKDPANSTEIGTDKVLLSLPAEEIYRGITSGIESDIDLQVERLYESLMTWEENMKLHYSVLGLEENAKEAIHRYPDTRINIRYMPMNNGVFMYAGGDHIGIQYGSGANLVQGDRQAETGYFGWGINHEIGHIINDGKFVVSETTNNIFSLFAQTINGGKSRLETSDVYSKIYDKVVSKDTGLASDVFVNLGMFWQLHLAYDKDNTSISQDDFYPTLHRLSRELNFEGLDAQNYFVRVASAAAGKDLTPFFERWGLHITEETYAYTSQFDEEKRALYYLNDEAMRYRLDNGSGMAQDSVVSITATPVASNQMSDKAVTLELSSNIAEEDLLGYEIYRGDELIAFTTEDTYVDEVTANNVSYTYSVIAYDKLLNTTQKADSDEVYIASEGIISPDEYYIERTTPGAMQVVLPNKPEVVGMKLNNITTSSPYTVEISQDGNEWVVAKQSQFKEGTSIIYFNKPGVGEEDDRIWTYDAKYIRITGAGVSDIKEDQIEILSYPGDGVYFMEGAIGYLASDYAFESGVIKEGSLVVMGTYRGHPIYSKIVLSAKYVNEKDYDDSERPGYTPESTIESIAGDLYMLAEIPEDEQISKVGNGIWIFVPESQTLPSQIKANMFRTDDATSTAGGRLVSDTKWLLVPSKEDMPKIELE